jgi:hypothetical protein
MESQLVEKEVLLRHTWITAEKGHTFWFDRWIALEILHQCSEAVCLVPLESLLIKEELLSHQTGITAEKANNFWSDY